MGWNHKNEAIYFPMDYRPAHFKKPLCFSRLGLWSTDHEVRPSCQTVSQPRIGRLAKKVATISIF